MTRTEYLRKLDKYLRKLPHKDYEEAMDYFTEYFDEAGPENEAKVIAELGSPREAANDIIQNILGKHIENGARKNHAQIIWIAILGILAAPLAIPLTIALLATLFAIIISVTALIFSFFVIGVTALLSSAYIIFESFTYLSTSLASTGFAFGIGLVALGASLLIILASIETAKVSGNIIISIINWGFRKGRKA